MKFLVLFVPSVLAAIVFAWMVLPARVQCPDCEGKFFPGEEDETRLFCPHCGTYLKGKDLKAKKKRKGKKKK